MTEYFHQIDETALKEELQHGRYATPSISIARFEDALDRKTETLLSQNMIMNRQNIPFYRI
ncbi:MAG: hypothetical protein EOM64_01035 [Erysipelotrichia bacterium]|nr:hypothetical protein [Erysipelotrichia bacterium]